MRLQTVDLQNSYIRKINAIKKRYYRKYIKAVHDNNFMLMKTDISRCHLIFNESY